MIKRISCSVVFLLMVATALPACAGIFNIGTSGGASSESSSSNVLVRPDAGSGRASTLVVPVESASPQRVPVESPPVYQPYTPPAASVLPAPISDDAEVRRYDRYANESDADYIARMKQVYKTSAAELERVGAEHLLRMQQLAPH